MHAELATKRYFERLHAIPRPLDRRSPDHELLANEWDPRPVSCFYAEICQYEVTMVRPGWLGWLGWLVLEEEI